MFSLRNPYILFLEEILKFKSQSYKSQKNIWTFFFNLISFIKPHIQPAFYYILKMHMHFTLGAYMYFQLHFRQFYRGSILYGSWIDCIHQQTELGPYWATLSGGIRDIAWRHILKWNKQLYNDKQYIPDTSQGARTIIVPSPWGYRRMIVRCPYDLMGPARASCGDLAGSLRLSQESTIIFGPKWQSKTLRCPHDHRAVPVRGS